MFDYILRLFLIAIINRYLKTKKNANMHLITILNDLQETYSYIKYLNVVDSE